MVYADGDASLPRQMEAGATQGVPLLQALVAAEIADLMDDAPTDAAMALAAGPLSDAAYDALVKAVAPDSPAGRALAKIGARNSRAHQERISACMTTPEASGQPVSRPRRVPAPTRPRAAMRSKRFGSNSPR